MSDDNTPDVPEEPDADLDDPQDGDTADQQEDHGDETEEVDVAELKTRLDEAEAEAARYKRRLIASDLRKKQVEKELRELRGTTNKKPEESRDDASKQQADPRDTELETLRRQVADANVRRQFDRINTYAWQNTDAAYRLLDLTDVRQDDGTVDRDDLQDAVAALAKDNPYLLKTDTPAKRTAERPTGQQPGSHRREQKPDKARLAGKFGALTGRV